MHHASCAQRCFCSSDCEWNPRYASSQCAAMSKFQWLVTPDLYSFSEVSRKLRYRWDPQSTLNMQRSLLQAIGPLKVKHFSASRLHWSLYLRLLASPLGPLSCGSIWRWSGRWHCFDNHCLFSLGRECGVCKILHHILPRIACLVCGRHSLANVNRI